MGMTNAEKQRLYRKRKKAIEDAQKAAASGDLDAVTEAQEGGVPVYLQGDLDEARDNGYADGYAKGLREGFAGGRVLEQVLDLFLDDAELDNEDEIRAMLRKNPHIEAVVRTEVVGAGVKRDDWLLWLGRA